MMMAVMPMMMMMTVTILRMPKVFFWFASLPKCFPCWDFWALRTKLSCFPGKICQRAAQSAIFPRQFWHTVWGAWFGTLPKCFTS